MGDVRKCASCGADIPADAPGGACPRCALAAALPPASADPTPEEVAAKLPAFDILGVLGRGGMGVVFKARQRALDRVVALKVLPPATAKAPGFSERFVREAKAMARLQHPNIVAVHEFGETVSENGGGLCWLVLEYVDGMNVREAMAAGRIGSKEALAIVPQICDALQYAHDRGVVHRDIKPENVMIDRDGRVRIADFGLAKLADRETGDPSLTGASQVMGTLHYMAPEQWERPKEVDHRCDIYSLGVVFYEMLTGELPVGKFEPPSRRAAIDVRVDDVVMRSLERNREQRWQRADEMKTKVSAISSTAAPAPWAPAGTSAPEEEDPFPSTYANAAIAGLVAVAFGVAAVAGDMPGLWWCAGTFGIGAAWMALEVLGKRDEQSRPNAPLSAHAPAAGSAPWLSPVMTAVAAVGGISLMASMAWAIHFGSHASGNAVGSLALVLGLVLVALLLIRRSQWTRANAAGSGPLGPPVLVGVVSGASIVLGLFCLVHAALEAKRDNAAAIEDEAAPEPPPRKATTPEDDRAPWDFEVVVSPSEDPSHEPSDGDRRGIASMWAKAQALQGAKWSNALAELYPLDDSAVLQGMSDESRADAVGKRALGPLFLTKSDADLGKFRIERVRLGDWSAKGRFTIATVHATDGAKTLRFSMRLASQHKDWAEAWLFAIAPLELE